jgi:universal stress protein E
MKLNKLKSIAVAVSDPFSDQQLAVTKAGAIAAQSGAQLTLLSTFMLPQPMPDMPLMGNKKIIAATVRQRRQQLQALARPLQRKGIRVRCEVHWDYPPHAAITRYVLRAKPDLLVADSQRHSRLLRLVLANTDWELIRNCPCPLWFVRSAKLPARLKLLVAVDPQHSHAKPSRLDDHLLNTAKVLSGALGAVIDIAHAYPPPAQIVTSPFAEPIVVPMTSQQLQRHVARIKHSVDRLARKHSITAAASHLQSGNPPEVLVELASSLKTDVLAMGAVSRSALDRLFIGNTAERVIDHVDCDVLVVKPAGFRTTVTRARPRVPL